MQSQGSTILLIGEESYLWYKSAAHVERSLADPVVRLQAPHLAFSVSLAVRRQLENVACSLQATTCRPAIRVLGYYNCACTKSQLLSCRVPSSWSSWSLTAARLIQRNSYSSHHQPVRPYFSALRRLLLRRILISLLAMTV